MKATAGFTFFLLFLAGIALVRMLGSAKLPDGMLGGGASLTGITWRAVSVRGEAIPDDSGLFLSLDVDGSIHGYGGCNKFGGSLEQTESGLGVGPLKVTRTICAKAVMSREQKFVAALQQTRQFQGGGESMRTLGDGDNILVEFVTD